MSDLLELPWHEAKLQSSPREYVDACIAAIESRDPQLHAFLHLNRHATGDGLPIAIKDNIVTTDLRHITDPAVGDRQVPPGGRARFTHEQVAAHDAPAAQQLPGCL